MISVVDCLDAPVVNNATRIVSGSTFGSVVVYTCPRGYYMGNTSDATFTGRRISTATVHCQANAQWSSQPDDCYSSCENRACAPIADEVEVCCCFIFSVVECDVMASWLGSQSNATRRTFDVVIEYWCGVGFEFPDLALSKWSRCDRNGFWQPSIVPCYCKFECLIQM